MPVVMELLPPWMQLSAEREAKRFEIIQRAAYLSQFDPDTLHLECKMRMALYDSYPADVRAIVQEEGPTLVKLAIKNGHRTAATIQKFIKQHKTSRIINNETPAGGLKELF